MLTASNLLLIKCDRVKYPPGGKATHKVNENVSPSLQIDFYDLLSNVELPVFNRSILALFILILSRLISLVFSTGLRFRYSNISLNFLQSEIKKFMRASSVAICLSLPRLVVFYT